MASSVHTPPIMYGRILRQLRESKGRLQAEVARSVGISPAQLARLESNQRGLYVEDFVRIAEALGEKPGNLLSNDLGAEVFSRMAGALGERPGNLLPTDRGDIGHLKPLIDRLNSVPPELFARVSIIIEKLVLLTEDMTPAARLPRQQDKSKSRSQPAGPRK